jgi:two-component system, sensor histidine kinase and response regulator
MTDIPSAAILIVDDEVAHMRALCETLQGQGYQTTGFASPVAALAGVENGRFALLLTDLMMPEMDGIALFEGARRKDPHLEGIIMTGEGTIATAVEAMKSGAMDYILKPFKLRAVLPVLERALSMRRLRLQNAVLEKRVGERTAELEIANKELEAFSYSVSHDLRAPLRHIDGFINIVLQDYAGEMPPGARRMLDIVSNSARRMGLLIDDLLHFSQLGRHQLGKQLINVSELFGEVLDELGKDHAGRKVDIQIGELPNCQGDRSLLRQVIVNLLSNAFKFTRQRENPAVEIGGRVEGEELVYFVRDNGAGFDMQYAGQLFGVFQRLHRAEEFEGSGIGLSIVQRIIVRHGGRIWADAAVDRGATFYFTLPI